MVIKDYKNIHEMIRTAVRRYAEITAYRWLSDGGVEESVRWADFYSDSMAAAKSLIRLGIKKGDRIAIFSNTCYTWLVCDFATVSIGAVTVGIYQSSIASDCEYILRHSGATIVFCEDETLLKLLHSIKKRIPGVKKVILFKGAQNKSNKWAMNFDDFMAAGARISESSVEKMIQKVKPSDTAFLVYTSGTTGEPKGVMITHDNLIFTAQNVAQCVPISENDHTFLFLPLSHIFARVDVYATALFGITLSFSRGIEHVLEDFKFAKPDWFPCVPRVFEKVYFKVLGAVESKGGAVLLIFRWALKIGSKVSDLIIAHKPVPFFLSIKYSIVKALVFKKILDALGGRVKFCVSGAAPLSPYVAKFFHGAGITILEGYGMTENTAFTNVNRENAIRFGSVGFPAHDIEQRIAADGEIQYRGRNVMKGYYKKPRETAQTFTRDGWLKTGDIGHVDNDGFLHITDRKKDIIITSGGKNIAPAPIETMLLESKYINQACLIGDRRKYCSALIAMDIDNLKKYAEKKGIQYGSPADLMSHKKIEELAEKIISRVNSNLASFETIKRFAIVPEFTIEEGTLTPTMKVKRKAVLEKYKSIIDSFYDEPTE